MRGAPFRRLVLLAGLATAMAGAIVALPPGAAADQASQPTSPAAGRIAAGAYHSCAVSAATLRCWGYGGHGVLGYGSAASIGDDETPGAVGPVDLGTARTVRAVAAGRFHTCALLDDATVRCWGFGGDGRLGLGNTASVGISQTPGAVGPVDLGAGRTATAISAGGAHTCALLDDGSVRCWGAGFDGRLGYGDADSIGDDETPAAAGPVKLGTGRTAAAISAGGAHTCALLDDGSVRCWGYGANGRLGYGNQTNVGDSATTTPDTAGPVDLGTDRTAVAISAGADHTCAVLDDGSVRCWGAGFDGQLGYGNTANVGDGEPPGSVGPVDLGTGRTAVAISAGGEHTCAVLDDGSVRCWGAGVFGQLGYASAASVGDTQSPGAAGPVDLGPGRSATAIVAGDLHTCALLDDAGVRCWGAGATGRLGYCSERNIGDDETPGAVGPVALAAGGPGCVADMRSAPIGVPGVTAGGGGGVPLSPGSDATPDGRLAAALRTQAERAARLRACRSAAARRPRRLRARARAACMRTHGRTPGRPAGLTAHSISQTSVTLAIVAPGSDGSRAPAARAYVIKQSRRAIRSRREFQRAPALCDGSCRFDVTVVGTRIDLTITGLRPGSTYHYAVAARDNVSNKLGPRSRTIRVRTR